MTAPGLPPHLCREQRVDDNCKDGIVAYTENENGWPPATKVQGLWLGATLRTLKLALCVLFSAWRRIDHVVDVLLQPLGVLGIQRMLFRPSEIALVATQQNRYLEQVLCVGVRVAGALLQGDGFESGLEHHLALQHLTRFDLVPQNRDM